MSLITENILDDWVRGHATEAQGLIVELVWRLVAASSPEPSNRRFPLGDSIGQPGPDGELETDFPFDPFVPEGHSCWEIGTNLDAGDKATSDYRELTKAVPESVRAEATFVFVTPLSGRRGWRSDWRHENQLAWLETRQSRSEWAGVRIIDGTKLVDWLHTMPAVELWLAKRLHVPVHELELPSEHWQIISSDEQATVLPPTTFLAGRQEACERLDAILRGDAMQLRLETNHPGQVLDFVSAYIASLEPERRADVAGRCVVISGASAWTHFVARGQPHVLIADPELDITSDRGARLLEKARRAGHRVVFSGPPGGVKQAISVPLANPPTYEIERTLREAGLPDERARILARRSNGDLSSLVRCFKDMPVIPAWAHGPHAADLAVAMLVGGWREETAGDIAIVETISGKPYAEWVRTLRNAAAEPGSPVTQQDGVWKFVPRHDGWQALASLVYDSQLDKFREAAIAVLAEDDPALQLSKDHRHAAAIYGKVFTHSATLREGVAQTLALMGAQPRALSSCTVGRATWGASQVVDGLLTDASASRWASLNGLLPTLAEASPSSFLDRVDTALGVDPSPFSEIFDLEDSGVFGRNYMCGLLWALETLAWEREHLGQVVNCLAELAVLDPGGKWTSRPMNSLVTIFLPWLPQTCAPFSARLAAVAAVQRSLPDIGWKLLLGLLPNANVFSNGAHKPTYRASIPEDWSDSVMETSFDEQTDGYIRLVLNAAGSDEGKLAELVGKIDSLPPSAWDLTASLLESERVRSLDEQVRYGLWKGLQGMIGKHRQFPDAVWAMTVEQVDRLMAIAGALAPTSPVIRHLSLFDPNDPVTYQDDGDWHKHTVALAQRRRDAIRDVLSIGLEALFEFMSAVESSMQVGISWGEIGNQEHDRLLIPVHLTSDVACFRDAASGYAWARFKTDGWAWVDSLPLRDWVPADAARLLASLPFNGEAWQRLEVLGPSVGKLYWPAANANIGIEPDQLLPGATKILANGRPYVAMRLLHRGLHIKQEVSTEILTGALLAAISGTADFADISAHEIGSLIETLQGRKDADIEAVCKIEWEFLALLDRHRGHEPVTLQRRMASNPAFFCHFVKLVKDGQSGSNDDTDPALRERVASNAYRLLSGWGVCPGVGDDGRVVAADFIAWLDHVKRECAESGHLEIAMSMLGKCLASAPADSDGLWLDRTVANALNARDADAMRKGMIAQFFNSRGPYGFSGGAAELEISKRYDERATAVSEAGYTRFAQDLRRLAQSYGLQAERDELRGPYGGQ